MHRCRELPIGASKLLSSMLPNLGSGSSTDATHFFWYILTPYGWGLVQSTPSQRRCKLGGVKRAHTAAKPCRDRPEYQSDRPEQRSPGDCLGSRVRSRRRLPLGLVDYLPVLLFVLGNLCACLIDGNILGLCQGLYRALARSFLSRGVTRQRRAHGRSRGIPQGGGIGSPAGATDRLVYGREGIRTPSQRRRHHLSGRLRC